MARLLADNNFPRPTTVELRRLGHDVVSLDEVGTVGCESTDEDVLQAAISTDRSLLTLDYRSFARLARAGARHPGVIICTFDVDFLNQAQRIDQTLSTMRQLDGQVIRIGRRRTVPA